MTPATFLALATALGPGGDVVAANCARIYPEIALAAEVADLPVAVVLAMAALESGCRNIEGEGTTDVTGAVQVAWPSWAALLEAEGWRSDELLGPSSVLMGARVLEVTQERWPRPLALRLCIFSGGTVALDYERDCTYSRRVMALAKELER